MKTNKLQILGLILATLPGCATITLSDPKVSQKPVSTTREERATEDGVVSEFGQSGTVIRLRAFATCEHFENTTIERTSERAYINRTPATDWLAGGAGLALSAIGVGVLVDAKNVYPDDTTGRQYNSVGPTTARLYGAGLALAGVALMAIPAVDAIRTAGTEREVTVDRDDSAPVGAPSRCKSGLTRPNLPVVGILLGAGQPASYPLGKTSADGSATIDLDKALPADLRATPERLQIRVARAFAGRASLEALFRQRQETRWSLLDTSSCRNPTATNACSEVESYLAQYPSSPHNSEAKELLKSAQPRLAELRDEDAWTATNSPLCSKTTPDDTALDCQFGLSVTYQTQSRETSSEACRIEISAGKRHDGLEYVQCCNWTGGNAAAGACMAVDRYVIDYPNGRHIAEARALRDATTKTYRKYFKAKFDKEEADSKREAREKAEAERGAARQQEEAERLERNQERNRCRARCQLRCSSVQFDFANCFAGCERAQCQ